MLIVVEVRSISIIFIMIIIIIIIFFIINFIIIIINTTTTMTSLTIYVSLGGSHLVVPEGFLEDLKNLGEPQDDE